MDQESGDAGDNFSVIFFFVLFKLCVSESDALGTWARRYNSH